MGAWCGEYAAREHFLCCRVQKIFFTSGAKKILRENFKDANCTQYAIMICK